MRLRREFSGTISHGVYPERMRFLAEFTPNGKKRFLAEPVPSKIMRFLASLGMTSEGLGMTSEGLGMTFF